MLVMVEAVTRLLPGVVGNRESVEFDSHADGLLEGAGIHPTGVVARATRCPRSCCPATTPRSRAGAARVAAADGDRRPDLLAALPEGALGDADRAVLGAAERPAGPGVGAHRGPGPGRPGAAVRRPARRSRHAARGRPVLVHARRRDGGGGVRPAGGRPGTGRGDRPRPSTPDALEGPVWLRRAVWPLFGETVDDRETYLALRDVVHEVDLRGPTEVEALGDQPLPLVDGRRDPREPRGVRARRLAERPSAAQGPWTGAPRIVPEDVAQ